MTRSIDSMLMQPGFRDCVAGKQCDVLPDAISRT